MRYLGLDVGQRSIGVAVGEALATELTTLRVKAPHSFHEEPKRAWAYAEIDRLRRQEAADAIVVGLPVDDNGDLSSEAKRIKEFGDGLAGPVHYVNETLTTFMAEDILEGQGLSVAEAKQRVDQLAAQLILQQYLEENARS